MSGMVLYLCQHGDALPKEVDPDRPLSDGGVADVRRVAGALQGGVDTASIVHSGKIRARQTAELFREILAPGAMVEARAGLDPNDPVDELAGWLIPRQENLIVAGHMPFVSRLASRLLGVETDVLAFAPGGIAALRRDQGAWTVAWMLTPSLVSKGRGEY